MRSRERRGIVIAPQIVVGSLPVVLADGPDKGKLSNEFTAPIGHGQLPTKAFLEILSDALPTDARGTVLLKIRVLRNGDGVTSDGDPSLVGAMVNENIPILIQGVKREGPDAKGGVFVLEKVVAAGKVVWVPSILELAQAKDKKEFVRIGFRPGDGPQLFNSNTALLYDNLLKPFLEKLEALVGRDKFLEIITPEIIENLKEKIRKTTGGAQVVLVKQLEGALVSTILNLNRFVLLAMADDSTPEKKALGDQIRQLMADLKFKDGRLVHFVNISEGPVDYIEGDLKVTRAKNFLKNNPAVAEVLGLPSVFNINALDEEKLLKILGGIIRQTPKFYASVPENLYADTIDKETDRLLTRAKAGDPTLTEDNIARLNRGLLEAICPVLIIDWRHRLFMPVKNGWDHYVYAYTDHFSVDPDSFTPVNEKPGHLPSRGEMDSYYGDFQRLLDAFGRLDLFNLTELSVKCVVQFRDAILRGNVLIEAAISEETLQAASSQADAIIAALIESKSLVRLPSGELLLKKTVAAIQDELTKNGVGKNVPNVVDVHGKAFVDVQDFLIALKKVAGQGEMLVRRELLMAAHPHAEEIIATLVTNRYLERNPANPKEYFLKKPFDRIKEDLVASKKFEGLADFLTVLSQAVPQGVDLNKVLDLPRGEQTGKLVLENAHVIVHENGRVTVQQFDMAQDGESTTDAAEADPFAQPQVLDTVGGINLDAAMMNMKVERTGDRVKVTVDPAEVQRIRAEGVAGFSPLVVNIVPAKGIIPEL
ncbi:MAG: hypothetical protein HQL18_00615 [Candidatus Omnitrophica bacterium]|nr:hypothetical protein [Candidatus Omnitrophota bacterium]